MAGTDPVTPEPRRFSIRLPRPLWIGLAGVVLVVACGALSIWLPYHLEQQVIQKIKGSGGSADTTEGGPDWLRELVGDKRMAVFDRVGCVYFEHRDSTFGDADLAELSGLTNLEQLYLEDTQVTDSGLVRLSGFKKLKLLDLTARPVSDAGLAHVSTLPNLQRLYLCGTAVSDAGLVQLAAMTKLELLDLSETAVSDAGLTHVRNLKNLKILDLDITQVGDAGVAQLTGMTSLEMLKLRETHVDDDGLELLRKALPDCLLIARGYFGRGRDPSPMW